MATQITYKNESGESITSQQIQQLSKFSKVTTINGRTKFIETISSNSKRTYTTIEHFMDSLENKEQVIQQILDSPKITRAIVYFNSIIQNGLTLWDYEVYSREFVLQYKGKQVLDEKSRIILDAPFDVITNGLLGGAIKKYYINESSNELDNLLVVINYDEFGGVDLICDFQEQFGYTKGISLSEFLSNAIYFQQAFPWNEHPYYHSLLPYLPDTGHL